ncbi:MAG TPA: gephyrin-like molybdotransferase Glp [Rudaea sp.]|nr:gephyrin-like molybdotransferase Glp [Rudaea sp.]
MDSLLTVEAAQALAVAAARPLGAERVGLREALGRVLAEAVTAPDDVPPHRNSAMDGFAVRSIDVGDASDVSAPVELRIVGEVAAGHAAARAIGAGEALRIMTGAPLPDGADAVVMVERTEAAGDRVRILEAARAGQHVREPGEDVRRGDVVVPAGATLGPAELGVLASARRAQVAVTRRPVVALLSTGDELRDVDQPLDARAGKIADTNSYALEALVREAGGVARVSPIVRDDRALLRAAIEDARAADLIVSTGGVSVGEHDHVKAVLAELGATLDAWRVNMKPGKPVALARLGATPYFGLPGNPVSAMVSFLLFVRPAIRTALGCARPFDLPTVAARLAQPLRTRGDRRSYLRAHLRSDGAGALTVEVAARQGSHVLSSMVGANALVAVEPGAHELAAGVMVRAIVIAAIG